MRVKLLGTLITGMIMTNIAHAAPQTHNVNMGASLNIATSLTVNGFNNVGNQTLTTLSDPNSLASGDVVDSTDLQNFTIYSNYGGGITVNATNNVGNSQSPSGPAFLVNTAGGPNIPYAINYTPCGGGAPVDLTTCTSSNGCAIPAANANSAICTSAPGSGNYTFKQVNAQLGAGTYVGGTNLTFSAGL